MLLLDKLLQMAHIIVIKMRKYCFLFLILIIFTNLSSLNKLQSKGDLIFTTKVPYCKKKYITKFEKRENIKISDFVKMIYSSGINIRDLCFIGGVSNSIVIDYIYPFGTIDRSSIRPSEEALLFGHKKDDASGLFFIDKDGIWYSDYRGKTLFKLVS